MAEKKAYVQSVDRSLQILELFIDHPTMSLIEISEAMGLAKTTVFGLIATLEKRNFLEQDDLTGRYKLGHRFIELSSIFYHRVDIISEATRILRPIAEINGHNAHITTRTGNSVTYIRQVVPENSTISINTILGSHAPANCTSSGKAFLSYLSDSELDDMFKRTPPVASTPLSITSLPKLKQHLKLVKTRGYATDCNESILGVTGVGVAVCNEFDKPIIGISVAGLSADFTDSLVLEYGALLRQAADKLRYYTRASSNIF